MSTTSERQGEDQNVLTAFLYLRLWAHRFTPQVVFPELLPVPVGHHLLSVWPSSEDSEPRFRTFLVIGESVKWALSFSREKRGAAALTIDGSINRCHPPNVPNH